MITSAGGGDGDIRVLHADDTNGVWCGFNAGCPSELNIIAGLSGGLNLGHLGSQEG